MIFMVLTLFCLYWSEVQGADDPKRVSQTPPFMVKREADPLVSGINCSHQIPSFQVILWYKQDEHKALKLMGYLNVNSPNLEDDVKGKISFDGDGRSHSSLNISALSLADSGVYFCAASLLNTYNDPAYFGPGTRLTVLEPDISVTAPTVTLLRPSPKECRNEKDQKRRKKTLVCLATGFYPDHIDVSWLVNDESVTDGVATDSAAQRPEGKKFYKISSRLRVAAEVWFNPDSVFTCQVSFFNGSGTENFTESIQGEAIVSQDVMTRDSYLKISQAAKLSYSIVVFKSCIYGAFVVFLVWKLQGRTGKQNF